MAIQRTFSIIKPDATRRNLTGKINSMIEAAGLRIFSEAKLDRTRRGMGTTSTIAALVDEVLGDARVRGLVVTLRSFRGGMASATSVRAVLARVVAGGRELVVSLPLGADGKELYIASAASRILVGPQAMVAPKAIFCGMCRMAAA